MKVTIIPIVIGAFGTVTKGLLKGLEDLEVGGRVETIVENGQNTEKNSGDFSEKPSAHADVKNSKRVNNDNNKNLDDPWICRVPFCQK